jgi:hypothetical protein
MAHVKDEILDLERRFWEEAGNQEFYKMAMADDGLAVIEPMGFGDKKLSVEMNGQSEAWKVVRMKDVHLIELTPDCVAVAYHGEGRQAKANAPYRSTICSVYVRRDGHWQVGVTSHQPWNPDAKA